MQPQRVKAVRVGCALSLLFVLAVGGVLFMRYESTTSCHNDKLLLKHITVTIDPSQDEQFIEHSRSFAFKHGFRLDIGTFAENSQDWRIRLIRKDVEVIARSPVHPGEFQIGFYNYDCIHPTAASDVDDLIVDFKSFMSEVPTALITE